MRSGIIEACRRAGFLVCSSGQGGHECPMGDAKRAGEKRCPARGRPVETDRLVAPGSQRSARELPSWA